MYHHAIPIHEHEYQVDSAATRKTIVDSGSMRFIIIIINQFVCENGWIDCSRLLTCGCVSLSVQPANIGGWLAVVVNVVVVVVQLLL